MEDSGSGAGEVELGELIARERASPFWYGVLERITIDQSQAA